MTIIDTSAETRRLIDVVRSKFLSGFTFRQYLHGAAAFSTIVGLTAGLVPADPETGDATRIASRLRSIPRHGLIILRSMQQWQRRSEWVRPGNFSTTMERSSGGQQANRAANPCPARQELGRLSGQADRSHA